VLAFGQDQPGDAVGDGHRVHHSAMSDDASIGRLLLDFPDGIVRKAEVLRTLVQQAVPNVVERVRPGWRLIGYDVPVGRRLRYFAFIAPEVEHIHLGFEHGVLMSDPERMLHGAHLRLRKVRFLTYRPGDRVPSKAVKGLIREAASIAALPRSERLALANSRTPDGARS
jgi:hypothetical protein